MLVFFGLMYRNNASLRTSLDTTAAGILIGAALFSVVLAVPTGVA